MTALISRNPPFKELQYNCHSDVDYHSLTPLTSLLYKDGLRLFTSQLFLWSCVWDKP